MSSERGQVTVFVVGLTLVTMAIAGIAIDGTRAFLHRRTLQNAADAAALAAASELDPGAAYGRGRIEVDPTAARALALRSLRERGIDARSQVTVAGDTVRVTVRGEVDATFLGLVGIDSIPVAASGASAPLRRAP